MTEPSEDAASTPARRRRWVRWAAGGAALVVIAAAVGWVIRDRSESDMPELACEVGQESAGTQDTADAPTEMGCDARGVLAPEAVVAADADVQYEELAAEGTSTARYTGAQQLAPGSVLVIDAPTGPYYGKVTAVDGEQVTMEPGTLADVFSDLEYAIDTVVPMNGEVTELGGDSVGPATEGADDPAGASPLDEESLAPGSGAPVVQQVAFGQGNSTTTTTPRSRDRSKKQKPACKASDVALELRASQDVQLGTLRTTGNWRTKTGLFGIKTQELLYADASISPSARFGLDARVAGKLNCSQSVPLVPNRQLGITAVTFGPVPAWITHELAVNLKGYAEVDVDLRLGFDVQANATFGARIDTRANGVSGPYATGSATASVRSSPEIALTLGAELEFVYTAKVFGVIGFAPSLRPYGEFEYSNVAEPPCPPATPCLAFHSGLLYGVDLAFGVSGPGRPSKRARLVSGEIEIPGALPFSKVLWAAPTTTTTTSSPSTTTTPPVTDVPSTPSPVGCTSGAAGSLQCDLDAASARWAQMAGSRYVLAYTFDGGGRTTYCVEAVAGDPSSVVPFTQGQGCDVTGSPDAGLGVEAWFARLQEWLDQGAVSSLTFDDQTGLPTTAEASFADGVTVTWEWLVPPA